jgi:hypothetical protein
METIERSGIPAVGVVSDSFVRMAESVAKAHGIDGARLAVYPGLIPADDDVSFQAKVREHVVPGVISGLAELAEAAAADDLDDEPTDAGQVVITGNFDAVQEAFLARGWSDGLPIVPPTVERIEKFVAQTHRDPGEVIGTLLPSRRHATVWNVAVNGVMAGCRPEYLPILLAVAEILADEGFRLEDAGSTPGWEPLVVVSGPMVERLGFNSGAGVLRAGQQANTTVGRFVRMYMRNVAGLRVLPDATDKACIGTQLMWCLPRTRRRCSSSGGLRTGVTSASRARKRRQ